MYNPADMTPEEIAAFETEYNALLDSKVYWKAYCNALDVENLLIKDILSLDPTIPNYDFHYEMYRSYIRTAKMHTAEKYAEYVETLEK